MQSKVPGRYYIIPFLYVILIAVLLYAQFGRASTMDLTIGGIGFRASYPPGRSGSASVLSDIRVTFGDMTLLADSARILVKDTAQNVRPARLVDYQTDTLRVTFDYESDTHISLFSTSPSGSSDRNSPLRGSMEIRVLGTDIEAIGLEVSGAVLQPDSRAPVFVENDTVAVFPVGSILDNGVLWVPMASPAQSVVLYEEHAVLAEDPFLAWLEDSYGFTDQTEVDGLRQRFLDAVYAGWAGRRLSTTSYGWATAEGTTAFDETLFTYLISESLRRGTFRTLYTQILRISSARANELTYRSAPLLGNVVRAAGTISGIDSEKNDRIRELLETQNPDLFLMEDLVPFVLDRAPSSIPREIAEFAARLTGDATLVSRAIGAIEYLRDIGEYDPDLRYNPELLVDRLNELVLPYLRADAFGLYLLDESDMVDIDATIRAGLLIESIGDGDLFAGIARELQAYGLRLADTSGFLPAYIDPERQATASDGKLAPEPLYARMTGNEYVPREISLFETDGPGVWIWTSAGNFSIEASESSYILEFDFPVGSAHHLIFRGIEPFVSVTLFGITWKNDPLFQNYTSGWTYDATRKTLYMKITHRSVRERVVITKTTAAR